MAGSALCGLELPRRAVGALALPAKIDGFPAFTVRSSRVQYNGGKRRSCSPS